MEKVCIIGLGKLGSHLYYSLNKTRQYRIHYTVKNSKAKIDPFKLNCCGIIFICTGDTVINKIVKVLTSSKYDLKNKFVYHTSGALSSDVLKPLKRKGAFIGSFHPVQTFDSRVAGHNKKLNSIYIAVEGNVKACTKAKEIIKSLRSHTIILKANDKVLHHINSVLASNYLIAYFNILNEISQDLSITYSGKKILKNGFKKSSFFNIYKPLIEQTIENIQAKGTVKSLTGPVERNDFTTIRLHLNTLKKRMPEMLPIYSLMGIVTAKIALKKKSITNYQARKMVKEFNKYLSSSKKRIRN
jgi:predicted short-subunit dehydrogenase-like oxidoreductase (DUF2520 family)